MRLPDFLLGRPLSSHEEEDQKVGVAAGIPMLGLDALSSAAYGPEAAMTLLLPLGAAGLPYVVPITTVIVAILLVVYIAKRAALRVEAVAGHLRRADSGG